MQDCKLVLSTPLAAHFRLSLSLLPKIEEENEHMSGVPYNNVIGNITYVIVCIHPDILYVISMVKKFIRNLSEVH
jgi:hypothetical protein